MRREASPAPPRPATGASRKRTAAPCSSTSSARLSMPAQDRLLRAVEYGEITRIGASKPISVDVRIVAATNENLPAQVDKGKFRADLLDRLSFEVITLAAAARAPGRHPAARRAFRPAHGGRARLAQLAGLHAARARPSSKPIPGPATCANCATSSSARSTATRIPSGRSTRSVSIRSTRRGRRRPATRATHAAGSRSRRQRRRRTASLHPCHRAAADLRPATSGPQSPTMSGSCSRTRCAATASTSARRPQRSSLSYDQLRHALKRHKLQDSARGL